MGPSAPLLPIIQTLHGHHSLTLSDPVLGVLGPDLLAVLPQPADLGTRVPVRPALKLGQLALTELEVARGLRDVRRDEHVQGRTLVMKRV